MSDVGLGVGGGSKAVRDAESEAEEGEHFPSLTTGACFSTSRTCVGFMSLSHNVVEAQGPSQGEQGVVWGEAAFWPSRKESQVVSVIDYDV